MTRGSLAGGVSPHRCPGQLGRLPFASGSWCLLLMVPALCSRPVSLCLAQFHLSNPILLSSLLLWLKQHHGPGWRDVLLFRKII